MKAGAWFVLAAILAIWLSVKIRRRIGARVPAIKSGNEILIKTQIIRLFGSLVPKIEDISQIETAKMKCGVVAWSQLIQLAEIELYTAENQLVTISSAENPGGSNPSSEGPDKLIDGLTGTKWLDEAVEQSDGSLSSTVILRLQDEVRVASWRSRRR